MGLVLAKTRQVPQAIELLVRATELDPEAFDAYVWLCNLFRMVGNVSEALINGEKAVALKPDDPTGYAALGLGRMAQGEPENAASLFAKASSLDPTSAPILHNLGRALQALSHEREAIQAFRRATELAPESPESFISLGQLLFETGDRTGSSKAFRRAYALEPTASRGLLQLAKAEIQDGNVEKAEELLRRTTRLDPKLAPAHGLLGNVLQQRGRFDDAIGSLQSAIALQPNVARPYFDLVYCQRISDGDRVLIKQMESLLDAKKSHREDLRHLHYALGKAHADLGEFETAMKHFDQANEIMSMLNREAFDTATHRAAIDKTISTFTSEKLTQPTEFSSYTDQPVFIVGMIRSGTTLIEQIVSSHPNVDAAGELLFWQENIGDALDLRSSQVDPTKLKDLAERYLSELASHGFGGKRVTDKMPLNFLYLGSIHMAFPNARIIHCRRSPIDTCLSIYLTPFPSPVNFAHNKENIVYFYKEYQRLMDHWQSVLPPNRFLEVDYERVVADRESESRRIIDFLALEWDEHCLQPDKNERVVRTPSLWQVRQPMYSTSVGRWRDYEPWLGAFRDLETNPD
jgi:tetratricopeptide (TPR) repeat protein